ncbi:Replication factor-A, RFA1 [Carpediemonas membranifera]|uniref:Replication factor-A, RFA1 n=1 Tax=Carpediemonas membranifera TaxID=201153 RepID=A0A8J6AP50_9EUKA|nr:Replication factor-A, RFA1 [Carpediemonas membranifera]|eukprot:KAG9389506.1 Replication factor-A, RFA1 [Carpediemonas membranifera]
MNLTKGIISELEMIRDSGRPVQQPYPFVLEVRGISPMGADMKNSILDVSDGERKTSMQASSAIVGNVQPGCVIKGSAYPMSGMLIVAECQVVNAGRSGYNAPQQQRQPARQVQIAAPPGWPALLDISDLNPFVGANNWTIVGRVSYKGPVRTFSSNGREGKVFNFNLKDAKGSEIRISGFTEIVDRFESTIEKGKAYFVKGGSIKKANPRYNRTNTQVEVTLSRDADIREATAFADAIPLESFSFVDSLQSVAAETTAKGSTLDVCGVVLSPGEAGTIRSKSSGREFTKRDVLIGDESMMKINVTIWGEAADRFPDRLVGRPVAFSGCQVGEFGGKRQLSMSRDGSFTDTPKAASQRWAALLQWTPTAPRDEAAFQWVPDPFGDGIISEDRSVDKFRQRLTVQQLRSIATHEVEAQPKTVFTKGFIVEVKYVKDRPFYYPSCKTPDCKKKVTRDDTGRWTCTKCEASFDQPNYRYIARAVISDHTGECQVQMFDETAEKVFGINANDFYRKTEVENAEGDELLEPCTLNQLVFRIRARADHYNETARVRYEVQGVYPVRPVEEARGLADVLMEHIASM